MSDGFLAGLIWGLIIGAILGAFVLIKVLQGMGII